MTFQKFESLGRITRDCVFTQKLNGTNAQIKIVHASQIENEGLIDVSSTAVSSDDQFEMYAGSRKKWISPGKQTDNFGFAGWCLGHSQELFEILGEGTHFGEWCGPGIQNGEGLTEKKLFLFNTHRWSDAVLPEWLGVVPTLGTGPIENWSRFADQLSDNGSYVVPGFMNVEGIVIYHTQSGAGFKYTYEGDDSHKWQLAQQS
jgi:hypothetical protein